LLNSTIKLFLLYKILSAFRATDNLTLNCTFTEPIPFFLQKGDILETYIIQKNSQYENNTIGFNILDASDQLVGTGSNLSEFEAKADGFYRLELSAPNCGIVKDLPIILSTVIEHHKILDTAGLQGIGSALLGLTGGIVIGLVQKQSKWEW
jgi:hypothetical protein